MAKRASLRIAVAGALCVLLVIAVVLVNPAQACAVHDARYAEFWCTQSMDRDPTQLASRLRRNPADIDALKLYAASAGPTGERQAVVLLTRFWPQDPQVLALRAADALGRADWAAAAGPLVQLAGLHESQPAAAALARMLGAGHAAALAPHLPTARLWLRRVLESMKPAGVAPTAATQLVADALRMKSVDPRVALHFIGQLQSASAWVDAHALWTALHGGSVPLLYNASFDRPLVSGGFDWEVQPQPPGGRAGAVVERTSGEQRGSVLVVRLNGKRFHSPLVRQSLVLAGGAYTLRGDYLTRQLRTDHGFVWVARCHGSGAVAGRSAALVDTGREWRRFEVAISPPGGCGAVVTLQLEAADPTETETGALGLIQFDALALERPGARAAIGMR